LSLQTLLSGSGLALDYVAYTTFKIFKPTLEYAENCVFKGTVKIYVWVKCNAARISPNVWGLLNLILAYYLFWKPSFFLSMSNLFLICRIFHIVFTTLNLNDLRFPNLQFTE